MKTLKARIARIIELSFLPVAGVFLTLFLLEQLGALSFCLRYDLLVCALPLLAIPGLLKIGPSEAKFHSGLFFLLAASILLALGLRLFPLIRNSIPLGYDPGFYKYTMELYSNCLPSIPETELAPWIKQMFEQGLFVLSDITHMIAGVSSLDNIKYLFPVLGVLVILPLFVVTRSLFNTRIGIIASLLYAVSCTQYTAFTMLYFKNIIGILILLLAIYALEKKNYGLIAIMFAALGIFHRPEFLLFALILIIYFILNRGRRSIILAVGVSAVLIAPFWIPRLTVYWDAISGGIGEGTFFSYNTYFFVALAYMPFAVIGIMYLILNKRFNSLFIFFTLTCIIVIFQLFFFNRFIIMLDIAIVIMAAVGIEYSLLQKKGILMAASSAAIVLIVIVSVYPTLTEAYEIKPRLNTDQLQALEWIKHNSEHDAFVLATSSDAPWVLGWSERKVVAPGLFDWYIQTKEEWFNFFESDDPEVAKQFMEAYDGPVYIFCSNNPGTDLDPDKFENGFFRKVYDKGSRVYKYIGGFR